MQLYGIHCAPLQMHLTSRYITPLPPTTECWQFRVGMSVTTVRLVSRSLSIECCGECDKFEVKYFTSICSMYRYLSLLFPPIRTYFRVFQVLSILRLIQYPLSTPSRGSPWGKILNRICSNQKVDLSSLTFLRQGWFESRKFSEPRGRQSRTVISC